MTERRHHARIPLEDVHYVVTLSAGRELPSVLLDISVCGARLGIPPHDALPPVGSELTLRDSSSPLGPLVENRTAIVMWSTGVQFGIRFTRHLDASLEEIAQLLQSEIYY